MEKLDGGNLGALLGGIRYGQVEKFEGLIKLAESNSQLACVQEELNRPKGCPKYESDTSPMGLARPQTGSLFSTTLGNRSKDPKCALN